MIYFISVFIIVLTIIFLFLLLPIKTNVYIDNNLFYLSIFTFLLIKIDGNKTINKLKNKIKIENIKSKTYENINIIKYIKINKLFIRCSYELSYRYAYIIYPLTSINTINDIINFSISDNNKLYICISIRLKDILLSLINKRRKENERTSNK